MKNKIKVKILHLYKVEFSEGWNIYGKFFPVYNCSNILKAYSKEEAIEKAKKELYYHKIAFNELKLKGVKKIW